jgi:hypothetical protein
MAPPAATQLWHRHTVVTVHACSCIPAEKHRNLPPQVKMSSADVTDVIFTKINGLAAR